MFVVALVSLSLAAEKPAHTVADKAKQGAHAAADAGHTLADKIQQGAHAVADKVGIHHHTEKVKDSAGNWVERVKDSIADAVGLGKGEADEAAAKVKAAAAKAKASAESTTESLSERAAAALGSVKDHVADAVGLGHHAADKKAQEAKAASESILGRAADAFGNVKDSLADAVGVGKKAAEAKAKEAERKAKEAAKAKGWFSSLFHHADEHAPEAHKKSKHGLFGLVAGILASLFTLGFWLSAAVVGGALYLYWRKGLTSAQRTEYCRQLRGFGSRLGLCSAAGKSSKKREKGEKADKPVKADTAEKVEKVEKPAARVGKSPKAAASPPKETVVRPQASEAQPRKVAAAIAAAEKAGSRQSPARKPGHGAARTTAE